MLENEGTQTLLDVLIPNSPLHAEVLDLPCAKILGKQDNPK